MNDIIEFEEMFLDKNKIIGISDIKSFSTGSCNCDWEYGFEIYLNGNTIKYHKGMKGYGCAGGPGRYQYKDMINKKRKELLNLWIGDKIDK